MSWLRRNPYTPYTASNPLRVRFGGSASKLMLAFAGGVCCTGVALGAWGVMHPKVSHGATSAAVTVPSAHAESIAKASCDGQTWPYITDNCRTEAKSGATGSHRNIRVVSTDGSAKKSDGSASAATQPAVDATVSSPTDSATATVPLPPVRPAQTQVAAAAAPTEVKHADKRQNPKQARAAKVASVAAVNPSAAALRRVSADGRRVTERRDFRAASQDDDADVVAQQTYRLGDGRRVVVIRSYRRGRARLDADGLAPERSLRGTNAYAYDDADDDTDDDAGPRFVGLPLSLLPGN